MAIRRYETDDRERVKAVMEAALRDAGDFFEDAPNDDDDTSYNEYITSGGEFLVGEVDHRIVATGAFRPVRGAIKKHLESIEDGTVELKRMHVDPDHQRQGYGQQIFEELQQRAQDQGYTDLVLITTGPQTAAQNFYEACGFEEIERETVDFFGGSFDGIVYQKSLSDAKK